MDRPTAPARPARGQLHPAGADPRAAGPDAAADPAGRPSGRRWPTAIQKVLEDANIKLAAVATDVLGVSGRAMIEALIAGQEDPKPGGPGPPATAAQDAGAAAALHGQVTEHHRFLLRLLMSHLDAWRG